MANESWQLENHGDYNKTNFFSRKWEFRNLVLKAISLDKQPSGVRLLQQLYGSYHARPTREKLGWRKCNLIFDTEGVQKRSVDDRQHRETLASNQQSTSEPFYLRSCETRLCKSCYCSCSTRGEIDAQSFACQAHPNHRSGIGIWGSTSAICRIIPDDWQKCAPGGSP